MLNERGNSYRSYRGPNPWMIRPQRSARPALRLVCLPYAGGNAAIYRSWSAQLPAWVEVCAVELPGRGTRLCEAPLTRLETAVAEMSHALRAEDDVPLALFGHSLGGLLAFELARQWRREGASISSQLIVAAAAAPPLSRPRSPVHALPDDEFIEKLRGFNGTPKEVLANRELIGLLLPGVRADFELFETYVYRAEPPLDCPITVIGGLRDRIVEQETLARWAEQTTRRFVLHMLPADHFFVNTDQRLLLSLVTAELERLVKDVAPLQHVEMRHAAPRGSTEDRRV